MDASKSALQAHWCKGRQFGVVTVPVHQSVAAAQLRIQHQTIVGFVHPILGRRLPWRIASAHSLVELDANASLPAAPGRRWIRKPRKPSECKDSYRLQTDTTARCRKGVDQARSMDVQGPARRLHNSACPPVMDETLFKAVESPQRSHDIFPAKIRHGGLSSTGTLGGRRAAAQAKHPRRHRSQVRRHESPRAHPEAENKEPL